MSNFCFYVLYCAPDCLYTIDFWIKYNDLAIEVDGPSHFIAPSEKPTGTSLAKRRYLNRVFEGRFYTITGNVVHSEETNIDKVFRKIDLTL